MIPFLIQLTEVGFELGEVSKVFQPRHLKLLTYRIVYQALECEKVGV